MKSPSKYCHGIRGHTSGVQIHHSCLKILPTQDHILYYNLSTAQQSTQALWDAVRRLELKKITGKTKNCPHTLTSKFIGCHIFYVPNMVGFHSMIIPDPYCSMAFCAELVVALDFDLLFKSCSTYCDKFECHAAPLALSCICHFTENDIFIGNHKGSSCCTPKPLPDNLHTIEPYWFCSQIHVLIQAR